MDDHTVVWRFAVDQANQMVYHYGMDDDATYAYKCNAIYKILSTVLYTCDLEPGHDGPHMQSLGWADGYWQWDDADGVWVITNGDDYDKD